MARPRISPRRALAFLCLGAIVLVSLEYALLRIVFMDRGYLNAAFARAADSHWYPDYPNFLRAVQAHTRDGDSIALIVPRAKWNGGYAYAYYRASYFLPGREVLPVLTPRDEVVVDNFRRARYAVFWRVPVPPGARVIWSGSGGALVARQ